MIDKHDAAIMAKAPSVANAMKHVETRRALLVLAPLSSSLMRSIGLGLNAAGNKQAADRAMVAAGRLSRRDGLTQTWLANSALRKSQTTAGLKHFDIFLRTYKPSETAAVINQLVAVLSYPDARKELVRYVDPANPWYARFMGAAVARAPSSAHVAELLLGAKKVPDGEFLRGHYALLFERLIREKAYTQAIRLYPRLPGAKAEVLRTVAVTPETLSVGYNPAIWAFSDHSDQGGSPLESKNGGALEFYAIPDTIGVAGQKLIEFPNHAMPQTLYWSIAERTVNGGSSAQWKLRCLTSETETTVQTVNLLAAKTGTLMRLAVPAGCRLAVLEMHMTGGIGRDPARIVVDRLALAGATPAAAIARPAE
ncbi:hypothetical protein [Sphingopyxis bauzanensis]|nr:hypothetical protein [Sphingopyxis bauzanensis]